MCRKLYLLICFVLVLGLAGSVPAASIDVNNGSFEYDVHGVQITAWTGWGNVQGWTLRDTTGWAGNWWGVDDEWGAGYEAADGNVSSFNITGFDPCDPNTGVCEIYQILDDPNAVIAANRRYTLTFNAISLNAAEIPIAYGALFYSTGEGEANDVILASESRTLTAPTFGQPNYAGWEEIEVSYTALPGADSIGKTLGVKLNNPYPWISGYPVAMDNVRLEWIWHTIAPVACIVGGNRIVEADSNCEARVVLDGSCSSDEDSTPGTNDDINDFDWYEIIDPCDPNTDIYLGSGGIIECNLPLGEHTILLEVTDTAGAFDSNGITVTVEDITPPEFSLSVEPSVLWPVNHKMVEIVPTFTVSDNCDESPEVTLVSITVNEGDDSTGGGHTDDDIQIDEGNIYLRAERNGKGTGPSTPLRAGRIYTIGYQAVDDSGNVSIDTAEVVVPHDRR